MLLEFPPLPLFIPPAPPAPPAPLPAIPLLPPLATLPPWPFAERLASFAQAAMNTQPEMRLTRIVEVLRMGSSGVFSAQRKLRAGFPTRAEDREAKHSPSSRRAAASET
jgi:hypothetical protein